MAGRYFENPYSPVPSLVGPEGTRVILKAAGLALKAVKAAAKAHQDVSGGGIYVGLGGVALTYLRIVQQVSRGFACQHSKYLQKHTKDRARILAEQFAADAEALLTSKRVTFLEGCSGPLALQAVLFGMSGDQARCRAKLQALEALFVSSVQCLDPEECEVLYGRAGYLYSLLWVEQALGPGTISRGVIREVVSHLLSQGLEGARRFDGARRFGLMYSWHGKNYLGAAHGLCGIVYVLLHCLPVVREVDPSGGGLAAVKTACDALAGSLLPSGNLPSSLGSKGEDRLVQWCHGAPGLIPTMVKAEQALGDGGGRYLAAAREAAQAVWSRGLLRKGVGLCHGISGNGYALLSLYRATGEPQYLGMAQSFALFAAEHWEELYEVPDRPASLYEGLAGAVSFWLDVVDPQNSSWPGAEL